MRRLLIDANVYLEFFRFSKDDLEELRKLAELIRRDEIELYVTQQLRDELLRNRETTLSRSFKTVSDAKIPSTFPQVLRNYQRFSALDAARRAYAYEVDKLLIRAREDAAQRKLPADDMLSELMSLATDLPITDETMAAARDRFDRGNPPGKDRSYGDAITWEALLAYHPQHTSLDLITSDSDYLSPLRKRALHEFLEVEWMARMQSTATVYENLTSFLQAHYPDIKLSTQVASEMAVARLESSGTFASTHEAIVNLHRISDFSNDQVQRLVDAALENSQVSMIIHDDDVKEFYEWLLKTFGDEVEAESVEALGERLLADD
jgi:hypothetical protein